MARTGLDRAPFPQGRVTGPCFVGAGGMSCDQRGVVGGGLLIWDSGAFLCPLDGFCHAALPIRGQLCSPVGCRRKRLDRVRPAIWGREVILIGLHPPLQWVLLLRLPSRIVWLLCRLRRPAPHSSFVLLACWAKGEGPGRCQSCRWKTGAQGGLRTFLDPTVEGRAVPARPEAQHSGWKHGFPRWADPVLRLLTGEFGAGYHALLGLSFLCSFVC